MLSVSSHVLNAHPPVGHPYAHCHSVPSHHRHHSGSPLGKRLRFECPCSAVLIFDQLSAAAMKLNPSVASERGLAQNFPLPLLYKNGRNLQTVIKLQSSVASASAPERNSSGKASEGSAETRTIIQAAVPSHRCHLGRCAGRRQL